MRDAGDLRGLGSLALASHQTCREVDRITIDLKIRSANSLNALTAIFPKIRNHPDPSMKNLADLFLKYVEWERKPLKDTEFHNAHHDRKSISYGMRLELENKFLGMLSMHIRSLGSEQQAAFTMQVLRRAPYFMRSAPELLAFFTVHTRNWAGIQGLTLQAQVEALDAMWNMTLQPGLNNYRTTIRNLIRQLPPGIGDALKARVQGG
jgi:hypothetical protein